MPIIFTEAQTLGTQSRFHNSCLLVCPSPQKRLRDFIKYLIRSQSFMKMRMRMGTRCPFGDLSVTFRWHFSDHTVTFWWPFFSLFSSFFPFYSASSKFFPFLLIISFLGFLLFFFILGLFCLVNLIATLFLALGNLWHNLHMFQDILELRVENKTKKLGNTFLIIWLQICGKMAWIVCKIT